MNDSGKPQRVENLPKISSNSTFRADDCEASAALVRDKPRNGGPDSVRVDGGSKNGGQLNALFSKRHAKDLTRPKSSHKRGRHDTESEPIKGFSDQEILFDVEGNHDGLLSGDEGDNLPKPYVLMHHPDSDISDIDGQDRDRYKVSDHGISDSGSAYSDQVSGSDDDPTSDDASDLSVHTQVTSDVVDEEHFNPLGRRKENEWKLSDKRVFVTNILLSMSVKWPLKIVFSNLSPNRLWLCLTRLN